MTGESIKIYQNSHFQRLLYCVRVGPKKIENCTLKPKQIRKAPFHLCLIQRVRRWEGATHEQGCSETRNIAEPMPLFVDRAGPILLLLQHTVVVLLLLCCKNSDKRSTLLQSHETAERRGLWSTLSGSHTDCNKIELTAVRANFAKSPPGIRNKNIYNIVGDQLCQVSDLFK